MNYEEIARLIPAKYRKEILETNMIFEASGGLSNNSSFYLHTIWKEFVEPDIGSCALCIQRVLENFRKIQQSIIDLSVEEGLLNAV